MFLRLLNPKLHQKGSDMSRILAKFIIWILKFVMAEVSAMYFTSTRIYIHLTHQLLNSPDRKLAYLQSADLI